MLTHDQLNTIQPIILHIEPITMQWKTSDLLQLRYKNSGGGHPKWTSRKKCWIKSSLSPQDWIMCMTELHIFHSFHSNQRDDDTDFAERAYASHEFPQIWKCKENRTDSFYGKIRYKWRVNTLGWDKMAAIFADDIFKFILLNGNDWFSNKISLKYNL